MATFSHTGLTVLGTEGDGDGGAYRDSFHAHPVGATTLRQGSRWILRSTSLQHIHCEQISQFGGEIGRGVDFWLGSISLRP